jgi:HPt (histidine-containing phosphotransfer) domain-containing protein
MGGADLERSVNQEKEIQSLIKNAKDSSLGRAIGAEAAAKLLLKYRGHLEGCVYSLTTHMNQGNLEGIRDVAHSLKGSGKSYGIDFITVLGLSLSTCAKQKDLEGLKKLIKKLEKWVINSFPGELI